MRIIHFIEYFQPDLGYQEYYLAKHQQAAGHEVLVVTSDRRLEPSGTGREGMGSRVVGTGLRRESGVQVLRLPVWFEVRPVCLVRGLAGAVGEHEPDAVHCHNLFYNWNAATLARAKRRLGFRLIVDTHANPLNTRLTNRPHKWAHSNLWFRPFVWPRVRAAADAFAAVGTEERDLLCEATGLKPDDVFVLPLGADTSLFAYDGDTRVAVRSDLGVSEDQPLLVHAGKVSQRKDVDVLLHAWATVAAEAPDARLLLMAEGPARYLGHLKSLAEELGISGSLIWRPLVAAERLHEYLSAADAGVWPGDAAATFQEAAACRLPIVIADADTGHTTNRILLSGGAALGFPRGNPDALARCLLRLVHDPGLRRSVGEKAEQLVRRDLDWSVISEAFVRLYRGEPVGGYVPDAAGGPR